MKKLILNSQFSVLNFKTHSQFSILNSQFSIIIITLLLLTSCSSPTSTATGTLSGTVTLVNDSGNPANNPVDFSGVTIALYNLAVLDTTVVRINQEYPNIGAQISQETEFDHRLQNPVKVTTTNADGSFTVKKIPTGTYNLVILKEGWGVRYFYNIDISKGDNSLESQNSRFSVLFHPKYVEGHSKVSHTQYSSNDLVLYPAKILSGFVIDSMTFESNHSYLIDDNVSFVGNVTLNLSAAIWIKPNMRMTLLTSFNIEQNANGYSSITSADKMYTIAQVQPSQIQRYDGVYCNENIPIGNSTINSVLITFATNGWTVRTSNINCRNVITRYCGIGLQLDQCNNIFISGCNISKSDNAGAGGISLTSCNQTSVSDNIFASNCIGLMQHRCLITSVQNNYFYKNSIKDLMNLYETTGSVKNCIFAESVLSIETSGQSNTNISYCTFQGIIGIFNTEQNNWPSSHFYANFNNFNCTQYNVKTKARYGSANLVNYNCENNYWNTTDTNVIEEKIWDRNDENVNDPEYEHYLGVVDYIPFKSMMVQNAGIINRNLLSLNIFR
jgi:hypothetical protein